MRDSKAMQGIAGLVTLAAAALAGFTLSGGCPPKIETGPPQAAGWFLAQQALHHLKPNGQVFLITRDTTSFKNPSTDVQLRSFLKTLRRARVSPSEVRSLQVDPLRPIEVPAGEFQELIRKAPPGSVIVSFMGPPPLLSPAQCRRLGDAKPAIVAFCPGALAGRVNLPALFEQGLLQMAVITRPTSPSSVDRPKTPQAWFERTYIAITGADATATAGGTP